ncbi:hypothetical protein MBLNU13_g04715t3 [Cladosporium sp. NU13]
MIELPGRGDRKADIFRLFNQWLRDPRNKQWQIVLDNVDDLAFLQPASSGSEHLMNPQANVRRSLTEYIPHCLHGSVMITSRSRNAACELVGYENILSIGPMGDAEALSLLATKLYGYDSERQSADEADRAELVSALDLVPLAVSQAAAFIMRQARYTIRQYLEALGKACVDGDVLSRNIRDLRRDNEDSRGQAVPDSVLLTWCLSFDQIRATRSTAADMLSLMSFCDRQAIPEVLLHCRDAPEDYRVDEESVEPPESQSGQETSGIDARASGDFEDDLSLLKDYSFITLMGSQSTFSIHGLVQLATRRWLHHHGQFERWKKQLINNVAATMPTGEFKDWKLCQTLYAHAKAALEWEPNEEEQQGKYQEAEAMSRRTLEGSEKMLGSDHPYTLQRILNLAVLMERTGRKVTAALLLKRIATRHSAAPGRE